MQSKKIKLAQESYIEGWKQQPYQFCLKNPNQVASSNSNRINEFDLIIKMNYFTTKLFLNIKSHAGNN